MFQICPVHSQQILKLKPSQIEAIFLEQNLSIIAERMNINIADAKIAQSKLWDNPELSVSDVNLWSSKSQKEGEKEVIPPLFGSFARNTQFSIELSQLIYTANKKGKEVCVEKAAKEMTIQEFEDLLRNMKFELRKSIYETLYLQSYLKVLKDQKNSLNQLINAYQKQVDAGNFAKNELLRLQSSELELDSEINETQTNINEHQKNLKALLCAEPSVSLEIINNATTSIKPEDISISNIINGLDESRPDLKRQGLQISYFDKVMNFEKSQRIPDITLSANYDRRGGVWRDFIGFGVSFNLPFLNRNQGNIKIAQLSKEQSKYQSQQQLRIAQYEVNEAFSNYELAYKFYQKVSDNKLLSELDNMLESYTKNLLKKNISMLEYTDFMDSYKANKQTVLTAQKNLELSFEELQYRIGTDIKTIDKE